MGLNDNSARNSNKELQIVYIFSSLHLVVIFTQLHENVWDLEGIKDKAAIRTHLTGYKLVDDWLNVKS